MFDSLATPWTVACPWDFPGKNSEVVCHFLLQGIFLIQGLNLHLLYWQAGSFITAPPGKPMIVISHILRGREKTFSHLRSGTYLVAQTVKNLACKAGARFSLWVGMSPGEGNGNPLQYSRLENSMDSGA